MSGEPVSRVSSLCSQACVQRVADAWYIAVTGINPWLSTDNVREQVHTMTVALVAVLARDTLDLQPVLQLGQELEALDTLQPQDIQAVQECLLQALADALPVDVWQNQQRRIASVLFALAVGMYTGKSRRVAKFNVAVTSQMGHDLKTPINAITGFSRVMLKGIDGPITDFQREDLTSIYDAGQRLLTMIDDLYAVRKQDAARTLIFDQPFRVSELLGDIVRVAQPLAAERDHPLGVRVVGDLGTMGLDPSRVRWVLLCLLCQMIRQRGGEEITLQAEREYGDGGRVVFTLQSRLRSGGLPTVPDTPALADPEGDLLVSQPDASGGDPELAICQRACEELQGTLSQLEDKKDALVYEVRLPAGNLNPA
ncbi:MAG: HAMP domain-containing histidine kinase [Anaerolineae bacterium]|nr:HAMP domain-containing histidine kinase [Anaerolineae bacterium]